MKNWIDPSVPLYRWVELAIRLVVGGLFIYAGAVKIGAPMNLADSVAAFKILPHVLIMPLAMALPPFEIIAGALLVAGYRQGALAIAAVTTVFIAAFISTLARGMTVDCGCFGGVGSATVATNSLDLVRDIVFVIAVMIVYVGRSHAAQTNAGNS